MKQLIINLLESFKKNKNFEEKYDLKLPDNISKQELKDIEDSFSMLPINFIKDHIDKILFKDLGAVHGRFLDKHEHGTIILNPSIFKNKKYFRINGETIPMKYFTIIHEIGHLVDHLKNISDSEEWLKLSGWKELSKNDRVPKGYKRYIEKRIGRNIPGKKKSEWIHKEDSDFVRNYASRNPKEDFADTFAFTVLGKEFDFENGGEKKIKIIKNILKG